VQSRDGGAVGEFNDEMSGGVADECVGWRSSLWLRGHVMRRYCTAAAEGQG
jgi:hypothetical protein